MKKTTLFVLCVVVAASAALSARAQDLAAANSAAQAVVDPLKAMAAEHLKNMRLPAASPTLFYRLDTVKNVDVGSGKTIKMTSYVSNCPSAEFPFAVDARAMSAGRAIPGGRPLVVAGVLVTWDIGSGACGGLAMPADFEAANPVPNSLPLVEAAGAGDYQLAEANSARLLAAGSPVSQIELTVYVGANDQLAGAFAIDATKQNGGKRAVIVGAIVFSPKPPPGVAVPTHMIAVRRVVRSPVGISSDSDIRVASR